MSRQYQSTLVRPSVDSRSQRPPQKLIRKPSWLTLSVAGVTVLAAAVAVSVVTLAPAPSPARLTAAAAPRQNAPMAAATVLQIARLRVTRDYLTDQRQMGLPIPVAAPAAPKPAPVPAAPAPAPAPQQPAAAAAPLSPAGAPQQIAMAMLASYGWSSSQFSCLDPLWQRESGWNVYAANPDGAYGIPQAYPGSKMASAGADWQTNAATQIRWGLGYIKATYGSPCAAWSQEQATGSY